jgi:hypothetical protein
MPFSRRCRLLGLCHKINASIRATSRAKLFPPACGGGGKRKVRLFIVGSSTPVFVGSRTPSNRVVRRLVGRFRNSNHMLRHSEARVNLKIGCGEPGIQNHHRGLSIRGPPSGAPQKSFAFGDPASAASRNDQAHMVGFFESLAGRPTDLSQRIADCTHELNKLKNASACFAITPLRHYLQQRRQPIAGPIARSGRRRRRRCAGMRGAA